MDQDIYEWLGNQRAEAGHPCQGPPPPPATAHDLLTQEPAPSRWRTPTAPTHPKGICRLQARTAGHSLSHTDNRRPGRPSRTPEGPGTAEKNLPNRPRGNAARTPGRSVDRAWQSRAYEETEKLPYQAMIDVDSLKAVNDIIGHDKGDELIKAVGQTLGEHATRAYHTSGDEFIVEGETPKRKSMPS